MADKRISDLPFASGISGADTSVLVDNGIDYQYSFALLLTFLSANLAIGANISFGTSLPLNTFGNNGDVFINTSAQSFAQKLAGTWTVVYTISATGTLDGTVIFGALSPPTSGVGNNGDTYINTSTGVFYKKASGTWSTVFTMATGPAGPRGNSILNGTGAPSAGTGTNGDFYLDTAALIMYGPKASGTWPGSGTSIQGSAGNTTLNGTTNPSNGQGNNGDFYINTTTWYIFGPKASGAWPGTGISIIGASGNAIIYGAGAPGSGIGNNGDFYINSTINFIYGPKALGAWPSGISLVGPAAKVTANLIQVAL